MVEYWLSSQLSTNIDVDSYIQNKCKQNLNVHSNTSTKKLEPMKTVNVLTARLVGSERLCVNFSLVKKDGKMRR